MQDRVNICMVFILLMLLTWFVALNGWLYGIVENNLFFKKLGDISLQRKSRNISISANVSSKPRNDSVLEHGGHVFNLSSNFTQKLGRTSIQDKTRNISAESSWKARNDTVHHAFNPTSNLMLGQPCAVKSPLLLGSQNIDLDRKPATMEETETNNPHVKAGGSCTPMNCRARHKVAIIIPFRNRDQHLLYFLEYYHPILQRQQLAYKIYVINQVGNQTFNKDKLMNVGFVESAKEGFGCFVFHDVDIILTNDNCWYGCQSMPIHLAHSIDKFGGLMYADYFGGAFGMTKEQYERTNGFPNNFWGWGGEDDVILFRIKDAGMRFMRQPNQTCKYKMVKHERDAGNPVNIQRYNQLLYRDAYQQDGLNTLKYKIVSTDVHHLYTQFNVDVLSDPLTERRIFTIFLFVLTVVATLFVIVKSNIRCG